MIAGADKITVAPVGRITPAAATEAVGDVRQQEFQRALAGLVGKSMPAEVLSKLTDGSFLVKVAGTAARMTLPSNPQPGAEVPLTLVSLNPRPTFQLTNAPQSAAIPAFVDLHPPATAEPLLYGATGTAGAAPTASLQRAASLPGAAPPAAPLADGDAGATRSTLSPAARVISSVLLVAARAEHPQTAIVAPLPLLPAASADPAKLAAALKDAIGESGLFYESHVAEWSAGKRPLGDLQREPQMQRAIRAEPASAPQAATAAPLAAAAPAAADPATAQFINLQLTSQEQGRIAWQGELWPGREMAWEISRDPPERGARQQAGAEAAEPPWRSALRLRFALLGEIGATVVLAGDQVHIQLQAGSSDVGSLLRARAADLQGAFAAAGSTLASLTVGVDGVPGDG
ncbi:MAG TPA: flagellar hook-length control protein FliK [Telluria sp.]|nr:flagellar hook-length control protein FliK [Telluria sp.]